MDRHAHGQVRTEVVDDRILVMTVDRVEKKNAFTPKISNERAAYPVSTTIPSCSSACSRSPATTRPPGWRCRCSSVPTPSPARRPSRSIRSASPPADQAVGDRGAGITFTIGIEIALAGDIVVAASDARFCQLEPKRGLAPLGGATIRYVQRRVGQRHVPPPAGRRVQRRRSAADRPGARGGRAGPAAGPGGRAGARAVGCAPLALQHTIANARLALDEDEPTAIDAIPAMSKAVMATADFQEGIASFIERRPARFTGH